MRDLSISMERANWIALLLMPAFAVLLLGPFAVLWGFLELRAGAAAVFRPWVFIPGFLVAIVVHEGLHALGFLIGRAPRAAVHFGIHRPTLSPFAGCHVPLSIGAYRLAVALPAIVLGALPWAWGMIGGIGWAAVAGTLMVIAAAGDLIVLWVTRDLPSRDRVLDHPERVGCRVVEPEPEPR